MRKDLYALMWRNRQKGGVGGCLEGLGPYSKTKDEDQSQMEPKEAEAWSWAVQRW